MKWTKEEDNLLLHFWNTMPIENLQKTYFKNRTSKMIKSRAYTTHKLRAKVFFRPKRFYKIPIIFTKEEAAYMAGIIDGEGTVSLYKAKKKMGFRLYPYLKITNTNISLINYLSEKLQSRVQRKNVGGQYGVRRLMGIQSNNRLKIIDILVQTLPYHIVKKEQAELVLDFCKIRENSYYNSDYSERELEIYQRIRELNSYKFRNIS